MSRKLIVASGLILAVLTMAGCNAVRGLGQDIESVGEAGDRAM